MWYPVSPGTLMWSLIEVLILIGSYWLCIFGCLRYKCEISVPAHALFCIPSRSFQAFTCLPGPCLVCFHRRLYAYMGLHVPKTKPGLYVCGFVLLLLPVNILFLWIFLVKEKQGKLWCSIKCCVWFHLVLHALVYSWLTWPQIIIVEDD